jgi:hypothetical protein
VFALKVQVPKGGLWPEATSVLVRWCFEPARHRRIKGAAVARSAACAGAGGGTPSWHSQKEAALCQN